MAHSAKVILSGLTLSLLMWSPLGAHGETGSTPRGDSTIVSSGLIQERAPGLKSGTTALLLSIVGTVVPAAASAMACGECSGPEDGGEALVFLGALVVGPSLGHFYADRPGRALAGIGIRTLALAGVAGAVAATWNTDNAGGEALGFVSLALGGAAVAWDIIRAPHSARVHNEKLQQGQAGLRFIPLHGTSGLGLRVSASF